MIDNEGVEEDSEAVDGDLEGIEDGDMDDDNTSEEDEESIFFAGKENIRDSPSPDFI